MAISLESNLNVISVEIFLNSFFVYSICRSSLPAAMGVRARELISMEFSRVSRRRSLARTPLAAGSDERMLYWQAIYFMAI